MRWLFKWALRLVLAAVALVVLLLLCRNSILRVVTENRIRAQTGMDVSIGRYSSELFSPVVTIEDLKVYNSAEFGGTPFLKIPEIHLELDPAALARRKLRFTLVRFNLAELDVVRNDAGQTNLFSIANKVGVHLPKGGGGGGGEKLLGDLEFDGIDVLNLSIGKARFVDLKNAGNNCENRFDLENQVFKNVRTRDDLSGVVFLLYLRSGGGLCFVPEKTLKDFLAEKLTGTKPKKHRATDAESAPEQP